MAPYATEGITACCRLKTKRQKRRALIKDRDRRLLHMGRRYYQLHAHRRNLPMVPVAPPYQRGWKRTFVLRADVAQSADAAFFATLLQKINTVMYHRNEQFTHYRRKTYRGKMLAEPIPQELIVFYSWQWDSAECPLTDKERRYFRPVVRWLPRWQKFSVHYEFAEPWRYVLQVSTHMVTHVRATDSELDSELQRIDNYLTGHHLYPVYTRLRGQSYSDLYRGNPADDNPFKNKPLHQILGEANDDNI